MKSQALRDLYETADSKVFSWEIDGLGLPVRQRKILKRILGRGESVRDVAERFSMSPSQIIDLVVKVSGDLERRRYGAPDFKPAKWKKIRSVCYGCGHLIRKDDETCGFCLRDEIDSHTKDSTEPITDLQCVGEIDV